MIKVLDLFSGTHSVQRAIDSDIALYGWEVTSLDLSMSDINVDIMEWDYASALGARGVGRKVSKAGRVGVAASRARNLRGARVAIDKMRSSTGR